MSFYSDINDQLSLLLGNGAAGSWSAGVQAEMKIIRDNGMNRALQPPPLPGHRRPHQWSFLRPRYTITGEGPYSTGTVTVASGVVTLSVDGTFPSWAADGEIEIDGTNYIVSTRDGDNQVTLADTSLTVATASAYILRQYRFLMPEDFGGIAGDITLRKTDDLDHLVLEHIHDDDMRRLRSRRDQQYEYPIYYTLYIRDHDQSATARYRMELYPGLEATQKIDMRYRKNTNDLSVSDTEPPGGEMHRQMFIEAILSEAELRFFDAPGVHTGRFQEQLATSISLDQQLIAPDSLGEMQNPSSDLFEMQFREMDSPYGFSTLSGGAVVPDGYDV